MLYDALKLSSF